MSQEATGIDEASGPDGDPAERREDARLLTGDARFTDDIRRPGMAYLALLGSRYPHARVAVETSAAEAAEGVLAVYTRDDLVAAGQRNVISTFDLDGAGSVDRPLLAEGTVRYQGQPVAAVVAEDRYAASDAVDRIEVEYDRLDAVTGIDEALDGPAPAIHRDAPDNVAFRWETGDGAATERAFAAAAHTVSLDLANNRVVPVAMEPRATVARYRADAGELLLETSGQTPHAIRERTADVLDVPERSVTVRVPAVGGGFGSKLYPYSGRLLAAWASMRLDRPVKWTARRSEDFRSMVHGRHQRDAVEAALDSAGRIRAVRGRVRVNVGGYPVSTGPGRRTARLLCGQYDVPVGHVSVVGVFTNTAPVAAYRGAGRPEAAYAIERLARACAREMGVDPVTFRRRNLVPADEFPAETPLGAVYDSGAYQESLDGALERVDYDGFRSRQERARAEGRYPGIGLSCYVNRNGLGADSVERCAVRVEPGGQVVARTGTQDTGQGHGTSYARIVADELGVDPDDVRIVEGDTDRVPAGDGTFGSRSVTMAGNALRAAARRLAEEGRRVAAADPARILDDPEPGLAATASFAPDGPTAPFGTHVAVVEVDPDTGAVDVERYVAVDDVGTQISPALVEAQVHGGVAQGIGQALFEEGRYDDVGNLVTAGLQEYAVPGAHHLPDVEWDSTVTPSPTNPLGVKGVGEAGAVAAPPAVVNAVVDALEPFGVDHLDMPLTNETVWRRLRASE